MAKHPSILIIGGGLSGLVLAHTLRRAANITVMEKARGVGGRMSTRYADPHYFDHGAQYFTARSEEFQHFLKPFLQDGLVQPWQPKIVTLQHNQAPTKRDWFEPHYVATPNMNALCKVLAEDLTVHKAHHVAELSRVANQWQVSLTDGTQWPEQFYWVISSAPAPQTETLLGENFSGHSALKNVVMQGCMSLLIGLEEAPVQPWQAAKVKDSPLEWIALNHHKPNRAGDGASILCLTSNDWAEEHLDDDVAATQALLEAELTALTGIQTAGAPYATLHRWRYAATATPLGQPYLLDEPQQLAACGDWCLQGNVEAAFTSAAQLGAALRPVL